jgi:hypothetical protein
MTDHSRMPDDVAAASECHQRHLQSPDPSTTLGPDRFGERSPPALIIAQAVRTLARLGVLVLFLWLTLKVDLVIFAGVLLAISLRRAADRVSGLTGIPVGGTLALVVLLVSVSSPGWVGFSHKRSPARSTNFPTVPAAAAKVGSIVGQSSIGKILMEHISSTSIKQSPIIMLQNFSA